MATACMLPANMLPYAERVWRRFPQALLTLGDPCLEDEFEVPPASGSSMQLEETASHKTVQITLVRKNSMGYGGYRAPSPYHEHRYANGAVPHSVGQHAAWSTLPGGVQFSSKFYDDPNLRGWGVNGSVLPPEQNHNQGICRALDSLEQEMSQLCAVWNAQNGQRAQQGRPGSPGFDSIEQEIFQLCALWNARKGKMTPGMPQGYNAQDAVPQPIQEQLNGQGKSSASRSLATSVTQRNAQAAPQSPSQMQSQNGTTANAHQHQKPAPMTESRRKRDDVPVYGPMTEMLKRSSPTNHHQPTKIEPDSPRSPGHYKPWKSESSSKLKHKKGGVDSSLRPGAKGPGITGADQGNTTSTSNDFDSLLRSRSTSPDMHLQKTQSLPPFRNNPASPTGSKENAKAIPLKGGIQARRKFSMTLALPAGSSPSPSGVSPKSSSQGMTVGMRLSFENNQDRVFLQSEGDDAKTTLCKEENETHKLVQRFDTQKQPMLPAAFPNKKTVIFFDWDDTICPTTWIKQTLTAHLDDSQKWLFDDDCPKSTKAALDWKKQIPAWFYHPLPDEDHWQEGLQKLQQIAIDTLLKAQKLGVVCIVTNAFPGWVEKTMKRWLPRLQPYILGHGARPPIKVLYAQNWGDKSSIPHVDEFYETVWWKKGAMHHALSVVNSLYRLSDSPDDPKPCSNIDTVISVGDSEAEMIGAHLGGLFWHRSRRKIYPNPTLDPQGFSAHRRSVRSASLTCTAKCLWDRKPWIKMLKFKDEPSIEDMQRELEDTKEALMYLLLHVQGHCRYDMSHGWHQHRGKQSVRGSANRRTQSQD